MTLIPPVPSLPGVWFPLGHGGSGSFVFVVVCLHEQPHELMYLGEKGKPLTA